MANTATNTLRKEHEAILKMLAAVEETARQIECGERVAPATMTGLLEFLRLFADKCHHGKEEDLLFPKLAEKGMPSNGGPVAVMLHEHQQGRAFIRQMVEAADAYSAGNEGASRNWAKAARNYVALLRAHIDKENFILFVMAEQMLSDAEQEAMAEAFERVEEEKMGAGTHERLHALMDTLLADIFKTAAARA